MEAATQIVSEKWGLNWCLFCWPRNAANRPWCQRSGEGPSCHSSEQTWVYPMWKGEVKVARPDGLQEQKDKKGHSVHLWGQGKGGPGALEEDKPPENRGAFKPKSLNAGALNSI